MAWNLKHLAKYPNITLYPFVIGKRLDYLFKNTNIYLDINEGNKKKILLNKKKKKTFQSYHLNQQQIKIINIQGMKYLIMIK